MHSSFWQSLRSAWRNCRWGIRKNGFKYLGLWLAFCVCSGFLLWQYDEQSVLSARSFGSGWFTAERLHLAALVLHKFGDFEFFIITISIILVIIGKIRSNSYFTRVASTLFIAGAIAGISVQVIKFTAGRPRPSMVQQGKVQDASFTGPSLSSKYRSYPSGHSTCTATAVTVLALALPRLLPFALMAALLVGASRVFYNAHYPTDVLSGLAFGMAVGGMCAAHLVRLRKRLVRKGQWAGSLRQNQSSTHELSAADQP